jgi:hypothetical protein
MAAQLHAQAADLLVLSGVVARSGGLAEVAITELGVQGGHQVRPLLGRPGVEVLRNPDRVDGLDRHREIRGR